MKLSLITYGLGNEIKPELIKPIKNSWVKPKGGLWASPINSAYGWKEWCEAEEFGNLSSSFSFEFEGNVLVIDSLHDIDKLPWFEQCPGYAIDFEKINADGFDAILLTEKGQKETRFTFPRSLYGWDCESIVIMNPDRIITTRINADAKSAA